MPDQVPTFYKNPSVATILSFFFMGLGQIYNGQIGKAVLFIVLYLISILLMFIIIGFITTPILWIWGMIDANNSAKRINQELAGEGRQTSAPAIPEGYKFSADQAAQAISVTRGTLQGYISSGRIHANPDGTIDAGELIRAGFIIRNFPLRSA